MQASNQERLCARVRAANKAYALANRLGPQLATALRPFVGKKVFIQGYILAQRVKDALPELPYGPMCRVSRYNSNYSLCWTVYISEPAGSDDQASFEASIYVGECSGHDLKALYPEDRYTGFRCDYTAEEVAAKREAFRAAEQAMRDARSALHPFGENDR